MTDKEFRAKSRAETVFEPLPEDDVPEEPRVYVYFRGVIIECWQPIDFLGKPMGLWPCILFDMKPMLMINLVTGHRHVVRIPYLKVSYNYESKNISQPQGQATREVQSPCADPQELAT